MGRLFALILCLITLQVCGQTKDELIDAIKAMNILENDDKGLPLEVPEDATEKKITLPSKTDNYENFKALVVRITRTELLSLANDTNPVIRMYAIRELFQQKNETLNFKQAFIQELERKVRIENHQGCTIDNEHTFEIFFHDLSSNWNYTKYLQLTKEHAFVDSILNAIDVYLVVNDVEVPEHFFETIFERRKFGRSYIDRIKDLVLLKDNFYAFEFLMKNYPDEFKKVNSDYLRDNFSTRQFNIKKYPRSFDELLKYSIQTSNRELEANLRMQYKRVKGKEYVR